MFCASVFHDHSFLYASYSTLRIFIHRIHGNIVLESLKKCTYMRKNEINSKKFNLEISSTLEISPNFVLMCMWLSLWGASTWTLIERLICPLRGLPYKSPMNYGKNRFGQSSLFLGEEREENQLDFSWILLSPILEWLIDFGLKDFGLTWSSSELENLLLQMIIDDPFRSPCVVVCIWHLPHRLMHGYWVASKWPLY